MTIAKLVSVVKVNHMLLYSNGLLNLKKATAFNILMVHHMLHCGFVLRGINKLDSTSMHRKYEELRTP